MSLRTRVGAILAAGLVAGTAAIALAPSVAPATVPVTLAAHSSPARPLVPSNGSALCLNADNDYCIVGEGSGNQVKTENDGSVNPTTWNFSSATNGYKIKPTSNSSVCLQGYGSGNGYHVNEEACSAGNTQQEWDFSSGSPFLIGCFGNDDNYMLVFADNTPKPVYDEAGPPSGTYYNWIG